MTKEELEKNAEEYLKKKNYTSGYIGYFASGYCKQAYVDSAEPREKQIEELEDKLSRVKNILLSYIEWEDAVTESKVYVYEDIFVNAIKEIEK